MLVDSVIFIGAIIVALTQAIKYIWPQVTGAVTIIVAILVGVVVSLLAPVIGVTSLSPAQGILIALVAVGIHTTASSVNAGVNTKV